jgi:hypothetical protein
MTIADCLGSAVAQNELDQAQADELVALYDRYVAQYRTAYGDAQARRLAQQELAERIEAEATQRRRAALLQLETMERVERYVYSYRDARGQINPGMAMIALIENHGQNVGGTSSIEGRRKAIVAAAHGHLEEMLHEFRRTNITGATRDKARQSNVVRELFGEATGDDMAARLAMAWRRVAEDLRIRYNEMGGAIGTRDDWGLPQRHDGRRMRLAQYDAWRDFIDGRLDWDRMSHHLTGKPILVSEREDVLKYIFDTVTSEGWAHQDPSMAVKGRGALVRQHAESRFLVFKSADAWMEYQKSFGEGEIMAAMMGHINMMARDIATMEVLGPNPDAAMQWLRQAVTKEAAEAARGAPARFPVKTEITGRKIRDAAGHARAQIDVAERMYAIVRGSAGMPTNQIAADVNGFVRHFVTAVSLGSAQLSAVTDPAFGALARRFAAGPTGSFGLASDMATAFGDLINGGMSRREAVRADLINDSMMHLMGESNRYVASTAGVGHVLADRVLAWQGLSTWTQASRHGFGLHMQGMFADHANNAWNKLAPELRRSLERYGFDEVDWNVMRQARQHDLRPGRGAASTTRAAGANILRPREMQELTAAALPSAVNENVRAAARALRGDLASMSDGNATMSLRELLERVEQIGLPELAEMARRFRLQDVDEMIALLDVLAGGDPRFAAGSLPTDALEDKVRRYMRGLSERYAEMIIQETDYAVPQATVRSRAFLTGESRPGTTQGELARYFSQFKSFAVAVMQLHVARIGRELAKGQRIGGARHAGALLISSTLLGALALQLKAMRDGKDPQQVDDPAFWGRAFAQGGGLGIWGDFLLADTNRFGGTWAETLAGPTVGRLENAWNLTAGNVRQLATDKDTNAGRELVKFLDANTPVASLWYVKLAWQRVVLDQLQELMDPEAATAFRRRQAYAEKQGTDYWWSPGDVAPERAPDFVGE